MQASKGAFKSYLCVNLKHPAFLVSFANWANFVFSMPCTSPLMSGMSYDDHDDMSCTSFVLMVLILFLQPEIEMVANGLKKNLRIEQRKHLLALFRGVCSSKCQRIAEEALGLVSNLEHPTIFSHAQYREILHRLTALKFIPHSTNTTPCTCL